MKVRLNLKLNGINVANASDETKVSSTKKKKTKILSTLAPPAIW